MQFTRTYVVTLMGVVVLASVGGIPVWRSSASSGDLPEYGVGDFWEYHVSKALRLTENGTVNLHGGVYTLTLDSKGAVSVCGTQADAFKFTVSGTGEFERGGSVSGDYTQNEVYYLSTIDLSLLFYKWNYAFTVKKGNEDVAPWSGEICYNPGLLRLQFPLNVGNSWSSQTTLTVNGNQTLSQNWNFTVESSEKMIDANSKEHETFKIKATSSTSGGYFLTYYAPDAGAVLQNESYDRLGTLIESHKLGRYSYSGTEFPWLWVGVAGGTVGAFIVLTVVYFMYKRKKREEEERARRSPMGMPAPGTAPPGPPPPGAPPGFQPGPPPAPGAPTVQVAPPPGPPGYGPSPGPPTAPPPGAPPGPPTAPPPGVPPGPPTAPPPGPPPGPPTAPPPGPPQAGIVPCARCGSPMPAHQKFCNNCGAPR